MPAKATPQFPAQSATDRFSVGAGPPGRTPGLALGVRRHCALLIAAFEIHFVDQFLAGEPKIQILQQQSRLTRPEVLAGGSQMRRDEDVVQAPQRTLRRQRLRGSEVQPSAGELGML